MDLIHKFKMATTRLKKLNSQNTYFTLFYSILLHLYTMYDSDFAILIILLADINSLLNFIVHGLNPQIQNGYQDALYCTILGGMC